MEVESQLWILNGPPRFTDRVLHHHAGEFFAWDGNVFEIRYRETIDPDKDRWELCSRVLARRDIVDRLSTPW